MAGIDNNTVLYLRGDSFNDLSLNPKNITNNGVTIINDGNFGKCFNFKNSNTFMYFVSDLFNFGTNDFTIEFFVKLNDTHSYHPLFMSGVSGTQGELAKCSIYENRIDYGGSLGTSGTKPLSSMANYSGKWIHVAMIRKSNNLKFYIDGVSTGEGKTQVYDLNNTRYSIGKDLWYPKNYFNGEMYNIRISNIARYTEDFTPPNQPYNSININVTNKTFSQIDFNVTKLSQETINKVEVLQGNIVKETYTDNYDNLTYNIDDSLCSIGNNKITIRVTYDDNYVEEEILTHTVTVNNLPTSSSLKDVIDRQELLNNSIEVQKNNLKNILVNKNVEVAEEENKLSSLIDKVNELGDAPPPPLYLYKEGDECVDITGGWIKHNPDSSFPDGVFEKYDTYIETGDSNNRYNYSGQRSANSIDVTNYSKLYIDASSRNRVGSVSITSYICRQSNYNVRGDNSRVASVESTTAGRQILEMDLTNITGLVYVYCNSWSASYNSDTCIMQTYNILLEN